MAASTSATLDEIAPWLQALGDDLARINWRRPLKALAVLLASYTKQNFERGASPDGTPWEPLHHARPNSRGGDLPLRDRGILMASVTASGAQGHVENITDTSLEWGTNLDYAGLHQDGGTVTPKNAKALSIPLTPEAARYRSPRDFPAGLFVWKAKSGHAFLAQAKQCQGKKRGGRLELQYLLLRSVTVPARPFVGLSEPLLKDADDLLVDEVTRQLGTTPA